MTMTNKMTEEQLERSNNPQTKELQRVILGILKAIDKVCKEHGLRYYLIAGTMLGAVRHKGFVPWDDDADVALPRKDYDILLANANKWLPEEYELVSNQTDPHYPYAFARIQDKRTTYILRRHFDFIGGLPVDVFPLDGMVENTLRRRIHYLQYYLFDKVKYFNLVDPYKHGRGLRSIFVKLMHNMFNTEHLHKHLDEIQREFSTDGSSLIADHDNRPQRGILPKEVYGKPQPVCFEDTVLMGVEQPDVYLRYCYGDYMQYPKDLPPQNYRYLNLKVPYEEYKKRHGKDSA